MWEVSRVLLLATPLNLRKLSYQKKRRLLIQGLLSPCLSDLSKTLGPVMAPSGNQIVHYEQEDNVNIDYEGGERSLVAGTFDPWGWKRVVGNYGPRDGTVPLKYHPDVWVGEMAIKLLVTHAQITR